MSLQLTARDRNRVLRRSIGYCRTIVKRRLLAADARCTYCRRWLTYKTATLDHKVPIAKGGGDHPDNLVLACWGCNQDKADKLIGPAPKPATKSKPAAEWVTHETKCVDAWSIKIENRGIAWRAVASRGGFADVVFPPDGTACRKLVAVRGIMVAIGVSEKPKNPIPEFKAPPNPTAGFKGPRVVYWPSEGNVR